MQIFLALLVQGTVMLQVRVKDDRSSLHDSEHHPVNVVLQICQLLSLGLYCPLEETHHFYQVLKKMKSYKVSSFVWINTPTNLSWLASEFLQYIIRKIWTVLYFWILFLSNDDSFILWSRVWWWWKSWIRWDCGGRWLDRNFARTVAFICIFFIIFLGLWKNGRLLVGNLGKYVFR